jgi:hypothetical protein
LGFTQTVGRRLSLRIVTQLINNIHETGERSKDFTEVGIALKKKQKATFCSDHRNVSLIAHIAQIAARTLKGRIESKIEDILGENLFGFKRGKGTTDAIGMTTMMTIMMIMMMISERTYGQGSVCVLIGWQMKERVNWTKLMPILKRTGTN